MFDVKNAVGAGGARGRAEDRRVALRRLPRALRRRAPPARRSTASRTSLDPTLVRGLDYYSRTTFEFIGPDENANSTICGGGRYDGLVEQIGGPPTPAIGFGAGLERLLLALENEGIAVEPPGIDVFFVVDDRARARARRCSALAELRRAGIAADTDYAGRSFKGQMTQAGRSGARTVVIVARGTT